MCCVPSIVIISPLSKTGLLIEPIASTPEFVLVGTNILLVVAESISIVNGSKSSSNIRYSCMTVPFTVFVPFADNK